MSHVYEGLSPELILDAIESIGFSPTGQTFTLNSYENRVFQIGLDDQNIVAKFYRPERWSNASIQEEHDFSQTLASEEIPVIAPIQNEQGQSLFDYQGFRFAVFPQRGGRTPNLEDLDQLEWIGRFLGRIHLLGMAKPFAQRPTLSPQTFGWDARERVLKSPLLPIEYKTRYENISKQLIELVETHFNEVSFPNIRLHGDCHPGNIMWTDNGPHFVDMDDCRMGPAVQDFWMLLSGSRQEMTEQLSALVDGYDMFCSYDTRQNQLIEPLRALRLLHYTAWLCDRWHDPAFPAAFTWFEDPHYWESHINDLQLQITLIQAPPLLGL